MTTTDRVALAKVLATHKVACARTLEQKISDAGPNPLRVDPHVLTTARGSLQSNGTLRRIQRGSSMWYALASTPADIVTAKLNRLLAIHLQLSQQNFNMRLGQTLEIAVFKALRDCHNLEFLGGFLDLDAHGDDQLYSKEESPGA